MNKIVRSQNKSPERNSLLAIRDIRGFTLLEITLSISVLSLGLVTLITLQTSYLSSYNSAENRSRAAIIGQYILNRIAVSKTPPEPGNKQGELVELLKTNGYMDYSSANDDEQQAILNWTYSLNVTPQEIPPFPDALRRVDLTISWSTHALDSFSLVYYIYVPRKP